MTTDTSKEAVEREICAPIIRMVDRGGSPSLDQCGRIIDTARALAAENKALREQAVTVQSQRPDETDMAIWQEGYDHGRKEALEEAAEIADQKAREHDIDGPDGFIATRSDLVHYNRELATAIRALIEKEGE